MNDASLRAHGDLPTPPPENNIPTVAVDVRLLVAYSSLVKHSVPPGKALKRNYCPLTLVRKETWCTQPLHTRPARPPPPSKAFAPSSMRSPPSLQSTSSKELPLTRRLTPQTSFTMHPHCKPTGRPDPVPQSWRQVTSMARQIAVSSVWSIMYPSLSYKEGAYALKDW